MKCKICFAVVGIAAITTSIALAQNSKDAPKPKTPAAPSAQPSHAAPPEMQLPEGWTEADMQACMVAATPGPEHAKLAESTGVWHGKTSLWMVPDSDPMMSSCSYTLTPFMDGRFF